MVLARMSRIPKRLVDDLKIVRIAENWTEILQAKIRQTPLTSILLRNGVVLNSPNEVSLNFLFHEIWLDEFYAPAGYEIDTDNVVVDIGANIGVFATWAATKASNVKVMSFEPFPSNAEYFRKNLEESHLDNVKFQMAAVGAGSGKRKLHVSDSWILHSLTSTDSNEKGIDVECVSLDQALAGIGKCDLLKIDCEGGEYEILYSASPETIQKIGKTVCEFNVLDDRSRNGKGLHEFFTANGFHVDKLKPLDKTSGFICARRI